MTNQMSAKEQAFLYDLFIVPGWREVFDRLVDDEIKMPQPGRILEVGCGTGGFVVSLAARLGRDSAIVGVDESAEMLKLARGKAEVQKLTHVQFASGSLAATGQADADFDVVIGDASLSAPESVGAILAELARVARPNATVVLKLATRSSFDEFFSIYWEALYEMGMDDLTPQLEALILERLTTDAAEALALEAGLRNVQSVTRREQFDYADAATFLSAPLIDTAFLHHWLAILPNEEAVSRARDKMAVIIERERQNMDFDVSIKATLVIGQK